VTLDPSVIAESAGLGSAPFRRGRHRSTWKTPSLLCSLTMRPPFRRPPSWLPLRGPRGACACCTPSPHGRVKCGQKWVLTACPKRICRC